MPTRIGNLNVVISANTSKLSRGLKGASAKVKRFGAGITRVGVRVAKVGAAMTAGLVAGTVALAKAQADAIDKLAKHAQAIGISTRALAGLQLAGERTGTSAQAVNKALATMTKNVGEAATGTGVAKDTLVALGLDIQELAQMQPDQVFLRIADAMGNMEGRTAKVAAASDLFGMRAVSMLNLIDLGTAAIKRIQAQAVSFGLAIGEEAAAKVEMMNDSLGDITAVFVGLGRAIAVNVAPFVQALADRFVELAITGPSMSAKVGGAFRFVAGMAAGALTAVDYLRAGFKALQIGGLIAVKGLVYAFEGLIAVIAKISGALGIDSALVRGLKKVAEGVNANLSVEIQALNEDINRLTSTDRNQQVTAAISAISRRTTAAAKIAAEEKQIARESIKAIATISAAGKPSAAMAAISAISAKAAPASTTSRSLDTTQRAGRFSEVDLSKTFLGAGKGGRVAIKGDPEQTSLLRSIRQAIVDSGATVLVN